MEIKDVNSLVNQILSGKTDLKSIAFESAFAEMVKEKSEEKQTTEVASRDVSANSKPAKKSAEVKVVSKTEAYNNDVSAPERKVEKKTSATSEKSAPEKNPTDVSTSKKVENSQKSESKPVSEKTETKTAETEKEAVSENGEAKGETSVVEEGALEAKVPFVETPVTEVISKKAGESESLEAFALAEGEVDAEGFVSLDPQGGKVVESEKQVAKVETEEAKVSDNAMIQPEEVAEAFEVFKKAQTEQVENLDDQTLVVKADEKRASKPDAAVDVSALADEKLVAQAEKISEIIGSDKKMKVSVDVKEEKIAYSTDKLVNNAVEVAEAVEEVVSKGTLTSDAELAQTANQNVSASKTAQVNPASVVPNQAVAAQVVATPNVSVEGAAAENLKTADLSVSNVSQAQVGGKAMLNAELVAKDENKATFKDVYKGMSKEAVEQVKVNITKSAVKGIDKINIQLKPEELGTIEVKMQIGKDGKISAHIVSSKPETLEILQKDVQSLEKAFNEAGFQTDGESLSFSYRQQQEENRAQLKSFIGDVLGKEAEVANQEYSWNANGGLNIRV